MARYQGFSPRTNTALAVPAVVELHAGDAAFLWGIRRKAIKSAKYRLRDLARADERVEAHVEGLEVAGEAGWACLVAELELGLPGAVFAGGVWAMRSGDEGRFGAVVDSARGSRSSLDALVSSFGWAWSGGTADDRPGLATLLVGGRTSHAATRTGARPPDTWARRLLLDGEATSRYLGVGAFAVCRVSPTDEEIVTLLTREKDPATLARAARTLGELAAPSGAMYLDVLLEHEVPEVRQAAAWSLALLHPYNPAPLQVLMAVADEVEPDFDMVEMAGRKLAVEKVPAWARSLVQAGHVRAALVAMAACGAPTLIDDILVHASKKETARLAGFAFSQITGADLVKLNLELQEKKDEEQAEAKNEKAAVGAAADLKGAVEETAEDEAPSKEQEEDSHLPVPDPELVAAWWREHKGEFDPGTRYLAGRPVTDPGLKQTLADGTQPQRRAAAVERACLRPGAPLDNTSQPGFVQARDHLGWT